MGRRRMGCRCYSLGGGGRLGGPELSCGSSVSGRRVAVGVGVPVCVGVGVAVGVCVGVGVGVTIGVAVAALHVTLIASENAPYFQGTRLL